MCNLILIHTWDGCWLWTDTTLKQKCWYSWGFLVIERTLTPLRSLQGEDDFNNNKNQCFIKPNFSPLPVIMVCDNFLFIDVRMRLLVGKSQFHPTDYTVGFTWMQIALWPFWYLPLYSYCCWYVVARSYRDHWPSFPFSFPFVHPGWYHIACPRELVDQDCRGSGV